MGFRVKGLGFSGFRVSAVGLAGFRVSLGLGFMGFGALGMVAATASFKGLLQ